MSRHSWNAPSRPSELRTERVCIRCRIVRVTRHDRGPSAIPWVEYYEPGGPLVDGGVLWRTPACEPVAVGEVA